MTDILQIFTGNPMSSFIGKKIEAATRPDLETDDWGLNIEICDHINENDDDAKDAIRAFKKKLQQVEQDRNFSVVNRTLTVLETCVSNCSRRFHILVMTKDFIQELVKLIGPKINPPIDIQERVLLMIERWAETFASQPDLSGVTTVYNDLKAKGVTFPPRDASSDVPIQTPQRSVPRAVSPTTEISTARLDHRRHSAQATTARPSGPIVLDGEGYSKINQDLSIVRTSIEMFTEILQMLQTKNDDSDWQLAADLNSTCRQMKERIVDLIERVGNEDLTVELLGLNDELNNIFIKYDRLLGERSKSNSGLTEPKVATHQQDVTFPTTTSDISASQIRAPALEPSLIDFGADKHAEDLNIDDPFAPTTSARRQVIGDGQDPFIEDLGKLSLGTRDKGESSSAKKNTVTIPEEISSLREQDFAEIENWLSSDSGRAVTSGEAPSLEPISIPNSEFENFIASRASAHSVTPESQIQGGRRTKPDQDPAV